MKIKSVPQLIDLVRAEKVNFTQTPQIDGDNIRVVKTYKNPPDPVSKIFAPDLYYKFDEDFTDSSTFGRDATPAGTAVPVINTSIKKLGAGSAQIKANGRLKYLTDGSTSGNTTAIPLHQYQVGWSVAFWFYATSVPDDQFWLFAKTTDNTWEAGARALYVDSSGNVHWARHGISNVQFLAHASNPICDGQWHHIVATYWQWDPVDPGAIKLRVYLDGASVDVVASVNMASWAGAVGKTFFTRGDASGGKDFYIDDFMYTNYPLSKATAIALWNSGNGTPADEADIV